PLPPPAPALAPAPPSPTRRPADLGVPAPALDLHQHAVGPGVLLLKLLPYLAAQFLTGRVAGKDPAVYQPHLFTDAYRIHPALIPVILRVNSAVQGKPQQRHLRIHLAAGMPQLPIDLLALVVLPGLAEGGVGECLEAVDVALGLVEVQTDAAPGGDRAVNGPDVPGNAVRRGYRLIIRPVEIEPVPRPDPGLVADPAALMMLLLYLVLMHHAAAVLAQVPGLAGLVRLPLQTEVTVFAAPLQVLLLRAVRPRHMEPEEVR